MFETAQQEPSGGSGKIIAAVVVVVVVALVVVYFAFLRGQPGAAPQREAPAEATAGGGGAPAADADYNRDLAIQKSNLGRDTQTQTMSMWDVQIYNRSRNIAYRNIKYATTYYDAGNNTIHQGSGTLPGEVQPGEYRTIAGVNDGLYPLNTARFAIELTGADGYTP